ncbi:TPA: hypothetical protein ACGCBD_002871 [Pseudomonas aeruginosa]|uniref:hypothetical protein n=1 Tax=Pseudomonas aeruginosa TaxID=287 RepID=UPI0003B9C222|nr:hypothetical protein [Pseudomonas aeruginosa]ERW09394.1 hypothetical protein Q037_00944 [Pseudomonas aeruginosa BWHPSA024]EZN51299.1 hypothetical protein AJ76_00611 [Pseudomonas aeruginosa BWH036]MCQ9744154.1 hypothetical protein [Pseudomonas aeruginosa]HBO4551279.1 hypothetical protein [Pseudomonas aeruginosa]HCF6419940.1 hypothetical protein [Pseudomonas aeruginosa]
MSKVQRFWCDEARNIRCVREDDFDALEAEAQALREEVDQQKFLIKVENDALKMMTAKANELKSEVEQLEEELEALRARVVVVPERDTGGSYYEEGWNACLDELARLNGLTVSEGLLRRIVTPALTSSDAQDRIGALEELRALLSEQE